MRRHLIVTYASTVVLLLAGRFAWQTCSWEIMSSVSSAATIASVLIIGWPIIRTHPEAGDEILLRGELLGTTRVALLLICVGALIAGFGDVFGRSLFGCR